MTGRASRQRSSKTHKVHLALDTLAEEIKQQNQTSFIVDSGEINQQHDRTPLSVKLSGSKHANHAESVVLLADGSYSRRPRVKRPDEHADRSRSEPEAAAAAVHEHTRVIRRAKWTQRRGPSRPAAVEERLVEALHYPSPLAPALAPLAAVQLPQAPAEAHTSVASFVTDCFALVGFVVCAWVLLQQMLALREQGKKHDISPRAKAVRKSRRSSQDENLTDPENLRSQLGQAGIALEPLEAGTGDGLRGLASEIRAKTCEILWVDDPERSSGMGKRMEGRRLVRLVRLIRALIRLHEQDGGISLLSEQSRTHTVLATKKQKMEQVLKPLTFKLSLDEASPTAHCEEFIEKRLSVPRDWQKRYMKLEERKTSYVEEQDSKSYPGLTTWYLIEEMTFNIDLGAIPQDDMTVLGLPDQQSFTTSNANDTEMVEYFWKWHPSDSSAEGYWRNQKEFGGGVDVARFNTARNAGQASMIRQGSRRSRSRTGSKSSSTRSSSRGQTRRSTSAGSVDQNVSDGIDKGASDGIDKNGSDGPRKEESF